MKIHKEVQEVSEVRELSMEIQEALRIVKEFQCWRRGADTEMLPPALIGQAIDVAIECLKNKIQ